MVQIIDNIFDNEIRNKAAKRFKDKGIELPTFEQMKNPDLIPLSIKEKLRGIGLWDLNPLNLFRITWKNEPIEKGGLYSNVNFIEIPEKLSGVKARIIVLLGKWFPTGAHKVGAAYGCLAPRIITGAFDPYYNKAVWPSTGNYCRGGAFVSYLMDCTAVAILPEEMSKERFDWLREIGAEVIATPGCESNVKEIYDKCWDIRRNRKDCIIFNQFDEFGNSVWHYNITGEAIKEIFDNIKNDKKRLSAYVSATGSAGTIAAGDYLRTIAPQIHIVASEALQCPTLLQNGFGGHRIEGIGDKHIPWIHNVKNTNVVTAIDDEDCMRLLRLFNEPEGHKILIEEGLDESFVNKLNVIGISGIANILSAIKSAKYFEMNENDYIFTIATDSAQMYLSRIKELKIEKGDYNQIQAAKDFETCLLNQKIDNLKELSFQDKKAIHNLKYFTWVEQQGKSIEDINQLWHDDEIWFKLFNQAKKWDGLIEEFNELVKNK